MIKEKRLEKQVLTWRRPRLLRREFELEMAGHEIARLVQVGFLRPQAEIYEIAGSEERLVLTFGRTGIFRQKLHAKTADLRFPTMKPAALSWRGEAAIQLDNGRRYTWQPANFWQTEWQLTDEVGRELVHIKRNTWGYGGQLSVRENDLDKEELSFLLYLGWYLVILKLDDSAAAAAAAAS
jgi:hypothetical protein